jgi:poly-gamma-glutamate system protein
MFGATDPEMTWLDMEKVLADEQIAPFRSAAASVGGGADNGRGLSPSGRQLLHDAISRNGAMLIEEASLQENIRRRVAVYDSLAGRENIRCYINVGGGLASLGGARNGRLIPPGISKRLPLKNYPNRGVINVLGERNIPVIHMLQVERLARTYGISTDPEAPSKPGKGQLFSRMKYNVPVVAGLSLMLLALQTVTLRSDLQSLLIRNLSPNGKAAETR